MNLHIVRKSDTTVYEISVTYILNHESDYDYQFLVSLINFGECFHESDLNFIAKEIDEKSTMLTTTDACNIQNAIADAMPNKVCKVRAEFDKSLNEYIILKI